MNTYQADCIITFETPERCEQAKIDVSGIPYVFVDKDGQPQEPEQAVRVFDETEERDEPLASSREVGISFSVVMALNTVDKKAVEQCFETEILAFFPDALETYADINCIDPDPPCFTIWRHSKEDAERIRRENAMVREYRKRD